MKNLVKLSLLLTLTLGLLSFSGGNHTIISAHSSAQPVAVMSAAIPQQDKKEQAVYMTRTEGKYHRDGCRYLSQSKIAIKLKDAIAKGYTACKICRP